MTTYGTGAPWLPGWGVWGYDNQTPCILALRGCHRFIVGRRLNGATMTNNEILAQLLHLVNDGHNHAQQGGADVVGHCRECGQALQRKSKNGRIPEFCSVNCRVANWRAKQRESKDNR